MADSSTSFDNAFKALTGYAPFPWQKRLFDDWFAKGKVPPSCNLPTGLGKTNVIAVWLIALAYGKGELPRRLVYVVNRRTVVDQATNIVEQMRQRLLDPQNPQWSAYGAPLRSLVRLLRRLAATEEIPLAVSTLRGELADNEQWKADPSRPAIIAGTIDMIGSKLLFSGYGDWRYGRAHHAGLIGQDALIIHDEAHLTPAFSDLLRSVAHAQGQSAESRPIQVMELSATSRGNDNDALQMEPQDERNAIVKQRLNAAKRLRLYEVEKAVVLSKLAELAREYERSPSKVLVYVRSPEEAQKVAAHLQNDAQDRIAVLTGTIRGCERDQLMQNPSPSRAGRIIRSFLDSTVPERTVYLVSTSAGEVGIDLDADHVVCSLTTLDSMIQRLGRVNRRGGSERVARVDVVADESETEPKEGASPVDQAVRSTYAILRQWVGKAGGELDASPGRFRTLLEGLSDDQRREAFSPKGAAPPLTDILLDAWSLTSIVERMPGRPEIAAYLHGLTNDPPETFVLWRKEISLLAQAQADDAALRNWFRACRPKAHERMHDRTDRVKKTLEALLKLHRKREANHDFPVVLLDEHGRAEWSSLSQIVERDFNIAYLTILLPVEAGGLNAYGMLDAHVDQDAPDVAEHGESQRERWLLVTNGLGDRYERLTTGEAADALPAGLCELERVVLREPPEGARDEGESRYLLLLVSPKESALENPEATETTQTLDNHANRTVEQVNRITDAVGLAPSLKDALAIAAQHHDRGKNRPVWQRYAGNPNPDSPLAKSRKYLHWRSLGGYRHEFGSVLDAAADPEIKDHAERDLILHLIAAHHGWARPHFESRACDPPPTTTTRNEESATEAMRRYSRLQQRFGRWGLAWLESLLRAADILASQRLALDDGAAREREEVNP